MNPLTPEYVDAIREAIESLPDDVQSRQIEQTDRRLESVCYQPFLIREPPDFLRITRDRLLAFIDELTRGAGEQQATEQDLNLLLHQYKFLHRLRLDDPDAWDEITELWQED